MSSSIVSSFDSSVKIRTAFLEEISGHLRSYRPDSRTMIVRAMKNPLSGFSPCLHQLISNLYDEVTSANREKSDNRGELWSRFKGIRGTVVEHIHSKKTESKDREALKANDLWLLHAGDGNFPNCFKASDHIADLLCLARISLKEELSEDACRLSESIQELLNSDLNTYFQLLASEEGAEALNKKFRGLLTDLEQAYTQKKYEKALQCIDSLDLLIHRQI